MVSGEWGEESFIRYSPLAIRISSEHDLRQTWPAVGPALVTIMLGP